MKLLLYINVLQILKGNCKKLNGCRQFHKMKFGTSHQFLICSTLVSLKDMWIFVCVCVRVMAVSEVFVSYGSELDISKLPSMFFVFFTVTESKAEHCLKSKYLVIKMGFLYSLEPFHIFSCYNCTVWCVLYTIMDDFVLIHHIKFTEDSGCNIGKCE